MRRGLSDQQAIVDWYSARVALAHPRAGAEERHEHTSRFVSPVAVAPHVAGAAVDLTLVGRDGRDLDLGTPVDATPEQSAGRCYSSTHAESRPGSPRSPSPASRP